MYLNKLGKDIGFVPIRVKKTRDSTRGLLCFFRKNRRVGRRRGFGGVPCSKKKDGEHMNDANGDTPVR